MDDNNNFTLVTRKGGKVITIEGDYEKVYMKDYAKAKRILTVIDRFIARICRDFSDKVIQAVKDNDNTFYLFKYNTNSKKGKTYNQHIENIPTAYILSGEWIDLVSKFFNYKNYRNIKSKILNNIKSNKYNNGIDPITDQKYTISIFHYKLNNSMFENGIMISRDGIEYN